MSDEEEVVGRREEEGKRRVLLKEDGKRKVGLAKVSWEEVLKGWEEAKSQRKKVTRKGSSICSYE